MEHSFNIDIASKYGVHSAIIINNMYFWIKKNKANNLNFYDGHYWTFNSTSAFSKIFPYLSEKQISYAISKLINAGIIITANYNNIAYDRTLWYAITDFGYSILQNCQMEATKLSNGSDKIVTPIPDINTNINTSIKPYIFYGENQKVFFTDEQYEKLKIDFPNDYEDRIQQLDDYMASIGIQYKDCLATIRNWARKEGYKFPSKDTKAEKKVEYVEIDTSNMSNEEYAELLKQEREKQEREELEKAKEE